MSEQRSTTKDRESPSPTAAECIAVESRFGAKNYKPLDVVIARARGSWVEDIAGKRYLDCLSAYSALNFGHYHPRIITALLDQVTEVALTSRAFRNAQLPFFCEELCRLTGLDTVLPMNTGAEAVETAIKAARKWGYQVKKIAPDKAEIIVCANNFHGRTTTIVGFSTEPQYREGFGPFTPGFKIIPFGDLAALRLAITENTAAFIVEPIQAEAGIIMPPPGYLSAAHELCASQNVLFIADEIQTGLGRTGRNFYCDHVGIKPDLFILGKSLGGGVLPVSAVIGRSDVMGVFTPGDHGSTFGGNPLACAVARAAMIVLKEEKLADRAAALGPPFMEWLRTIKNPDIVQVRGEGLLIGIEFRVPVRPLCERLKEEGVLCKETHDKILRIAPPLIVTEEELNWAFSRFEKVLSSG